MLKYSEKELISLFRKQGSENYAFNLIVEMYKERLYWHIRKIIIDHDDTDDVLQNTFIKVWKGLSGFREDSLLYTWIYRIATNEALSFLKQKRTKYILPIINVERQLTETLESDEYFNGDEIHLKLQRAILTLPEKQRIIFNMKYFDEMKYDDISGILGTSVGALKASYHHAVKKIEKYLTEN
jgi:RNA polymerase sigma factor (sigma-70 family)